MGRTEIENLRVAISAPSVSGRLTRLRMLLVDLEKDEQTVSKRVCEGLRKEFHKILKTENLDNEILATAARLLLRLDRIDKFKLKSRSEKQKSLELAERLSAPEPETPAAPPPPTGGIDIWDLV